MKVALHHEIETWLPWGKIQSSRGPIFVSVWRRQPSRHRPGMTKHRRVGGTVMVCSARGSGALSAELTGVGGGQKCMQHPQRLYGVGTGASGSHAVASY